MRTGGYNDYNPIKTTDGHIKKKRDTIYMFESPRNGSFPCSKQQEVPREWCLDAAFTSIIPPFGNRNEKSREKRAIGARDPGEGYVFVLSFQVMSADEIRCYCCFGGQMFRFMPGDISRVWPCIFEEAKDRNWRQHQRKRKKDLEDVESRLRGVMKGWDDRFQRFREITKRKS